MEEVRTFREEQSEKVSALYLRVMRGQKGIRSQALKEYLGRIFLQNPWHQDGVESLLYLQDGKIVGFLGVICRQMEFSGRAITAGIMTQFMIDRDLHKGKGPLHLLQRFFSGPQDLSYTDGASEPAAKAWEKAGGDAARLYSFNWLRPLRPVATIQEHSTGRRQGGIWIAINGAAAILGLPIDAVAQRFLRPHSPFESVAVDSGTLFETITEIGWREKLKPSYERDSFGWLISEAAQAKYGQLRLRVTREQDGKACGWFVYYLKPGGACYLLQIGARRVDQYRGVLRALFADAAAGGGTCVKGQSQPRHLVDLTEEHCLFRHPQSSVWIASRDPELKVAIHRGDAALSRLDGESWLRFHAEDWLKPS